MFFTLLKKLSSSNYAEELECLYLAWRRGKLSQESFKTERLEQTISVFLLYRNVFPNFLFYFIVKFLYQTVCLPVGGSKASLKIYWFKITLGRYQFRNWFLQQIECDNKKNTVKDSGHLDSTTFCVCVNYVHVKPAKFNANFSFIFYAKRLQKWAKCILRSHYFNLSWEPANIIIVYVLFIEVLLCLIV